MFLVIISTIFQILYRKYDSEEYSSRIETKAVLLVGVHSS